MSSPPPIGQPTPLGAGGPGPGPTPTSIPKLWLDEIVAAVRADRPSWILTLLGSSVVAAIIAAGSSILGSYVTLKTNGDLEAKKIHLLDEQAEFKSKLAAYQQLDQKLNQLLTQFKGLVAEAQIESQIHEPSQSKRVSLPQLEFQPMGVTEYVILDLKTDAHIDSKTGDAVEAVIGRIAQATSDVGPNYSKLLISADSIVTDLSATIHKTRQTRADLAAHPEYGDDKSGYK